MENLVLKHPMSRVRFAPKADTKTWNLWDFLVTSSTPAYNSELADGYIERWASQQFGIKIPNDSK